MNRIHWAWFVLLASFTSVFTYYSIRMGYGILMPEMILSLKITKAQAGIIASSFYLAYCIFSPILGFLADRFNARVLLPVFACILGAGTFLMGKPTTLYQACSFYFLVGIGGSAMWTPVAALVQRWFGDRRRGMALGLLSVGYGVGYGLMGLILPPLVAQYGWRTCWFILAGLAFALVPLNGSLIRTKPQDLNLSPWGEGPVSLPKNFSPRAAGKVSYRDLLRLPSLWLTAIAYSFTAFSAYVINIFIVTYGVMELKYPFAQAAHLASAIAFSVIPGSFFLPFLSDYIGRKKCLILINSSMSVSILLIIWAGKDWPGLFAASCLFGFFFSAPFPVYAATAADFFPRGATGSVIGFWTIFYGLSLVLAPSLGGYLADLTGTFVYTFLAGAIAGILAIFFLWPMQKDKQPSGPEGA